MATILPPTVLQPAGQGQMFPIQAFPLNKPIQYNSKTARTLGILQIVIGCLCAIFTVVIILVYKLTSYSSNYFYAICGYGIWCGAIFAVAGLLGILSGKKPPNKCMIIASMVMSIIAAGFSPVVLVLGIADAADARILFTYNRYNSYTSYSDDGQSNNINVVIAMGSLLAILSVTEAVVAIVSSVLCCRAVCCCNNSPPMAHYTVYNPNTQQMPQDYYPQGVVPQYVPGPPPYQPYPLPHQPYPSPHQPYLPPHQPYPPPHQQYPPPQSFQNPTAPIVDPRQAQQGTTNEAFGEFSFPPPHEPEKKA